MRTELRRQGIVPVRINKQLQLFAKKGKVTALDIAMFSRMMSTMMSAGVPLVQSFEIIGSGHENPAMQTPDSRHQDRRRGRHGAGRCAGQASASL